MTVVALTRLTAMILAADIPSSFCRLLPLLAYLNVLALSVASDIEMICKNSKQQSTCSQCIRAHLGCAWCTDPSYSKGKRCDTFDNLLDICPKEFIYQPDKKIDRIMDEPVNPGRVQLQPQKINLQIRPGQTTSFQLKYLHMNTHKRDIYLLNSETESRGIQLTYENDCLGKPTLGRSCSGARLYDIITFTINVTLTECVEPIGGAVVSIGLHEVRNILALYVTPQCRCDCESAVHMQTLSAECNSAGNMVCGACLCISGKTGPKCQCDNQDDRCRQTPSSAICSGRGRCECGQCQCNDSENIKGEFCECDITSCSLYEGLICAGKGTCDCGKCFCEANRTGQICECPTDNSACIKNGIVCSNTGECQCGSCVCHDGFDGEFCDQVMENAEYEDDEMHSVSQTGTESSSSSANDNKYSSPMGEERHKSTKADTTKTGSSSSSNRNSVFTDQHTTHDYTDLFSSLSSTTVSPTEQVKSLAAANLTADFRIILLLTMLLSCAAIMI